MLPRPAPSLDLGALRPLALILAVVALVAPAQAGPELLVTDQSEILYRVDPTGGTLGSVAISHDLTGLAVHPLTGVVYGVTSTADVSCAACLVSVDPFTPSSTAIGTGVGAALVDIAFAPDGTLYGITGGTSALVTVNVTSGVAASIGSTGQAGSGIAFLPPLGPSAILYMTPTSDTGTLYTLNTTTGAATAGVTLTGVGSPLYSASSNAGGDRIFASRSDTSSILSIDPSTGAVTIQAALPSTVCDGLAVWESLAGEYAVNVTSTGYADYPDAAMDASGNFMVVWQNQDSGGDNDVFLRRFSASGAPLTTDVFVAGGLTAHQIRPAVSAASDGRFVVVWQDGSYPGDIKGRLYDASGGVVKNFTVAANAGVNEQQPDVAMTPGGEFVVVWTGADASGTGIRGRRYNSGGVAKAAAFLVNSYVTNDQRGPSVAAAGDGSFVVAWESYEGFSGGGDSIKVRAFDAAGAPRGAQFQVDGGGVYYGQYDPSLTSDAAGNFVVAWTECSSCFGFAGPPPPPSLRAPGAPGIAGDFSGTAVAGRRYNANLTSAAGPFLVNTFTFNSQRSAAAASDADGNWVVSWSSYGEDGSYDSIRGRTVKADGTTQAAGLAVNEFTHRYQSRPATAFAAGQDYVVAWRTPDDDQEGIVVRRVAFGPSISIVNPRANASWAWDASRRINWVFTKGTTPPFDIELTRTVGTVPGVEPVTSGVAADAGSPQTKGHFIWDPVTPPTSDGLGAVFTVADSGSTTDDSSAFTIASGFINNISPPTSTDLWFEGETHRIWFNHNLGTSATVEVAVTYDGGLNFAVVDPAYTLPGGGRTYYDWTISGATNSGPPFVPGPQAPHLSAGTGAQLRFTWNNTGGTMTNAAVGFSSLFEVRIPVIAVTRPNAMNVDFGVDSAQAVTVSHNLTNASNNGSSFIKLELSTDGGSTFPVPLSDGRPVGGTSNSLTYRWTVPDLVGDNNLVRATINGIPSVSDVSDNAFSISPPALSITQLGSGPTWTVGTAEEIKWTHNLGSNPAGTVPTYSVTIERSLDAGANWATLATGYVTGFGAGAGYPKSPTRGIFSYTPVGGDVGTAIFRITWETTSASYGTVSTTSSPVTIVAGP